MIVFLCRYVLRNSKGKCWRTKRTLLICTVVSYLPCYRHRLEGPKTRRSRKDHSKKRRRHAQTTNFTLDVIIDDVREAPLLKTAPDDHPSAKRLPAEAARPHSIERRPARLLLKKERAPVAVITNDQGARLVDGDLFNDLRIPSALKSSMAAFVVITRIWTKQIRTTDATSPQPAVLFYRVRSAPHLKPRSHGPKATAATAPGMANYRLRIRRRCSSTRPAPSFESRRPLYLFPGKQLEEAQVIVISKDRPNKQQARPATKITTALSG